VHARNTPFIFWNLLDLCPCGYEYINFKNLFMTTYIFLTLLLLGVHE